MAEYILLLGVSLAVFLALLAAFGASAATADNDATTITAENVAGAVSSAICDTVGDGTVSATVSLDLPEAICGRPYLVCPCDARHVSVRVCRAHDGGMFVAPVPLRQGDIRMEGFTVSGQGRMGIAYDAAARTVTIS